MVGVLGEETREWEWEGEGKVREREVKRVEEGGAVEVSAGIVAVVAVVVVVVAVGGGGVVVVCGGVWLVWEDGPSSLCTWKRGEGW